MVKVRLFGLLRLDTGIKEFTADAADVRSLYPVIIEEAKKRDPSLSVRKADIDGCIVLVNGVQKSKNAKLKDGDIVVLMSAVSGG